MGTISMIKLVNRNENNSHFYSVSIDWIDEGHAGCIFFALGIASIYLSWLTDDQERRCLPIGKPNIMVEERRGRGARGRRDRLLEPGDLRLVMLELLRTRARYGYDFIKAIAGLASTDRPCDARPGQRRQEALCHYAAGHCFSGKPARCLAARPRAPRIGRIGR